MAQRVKYILAGIAAGAVNGFFGTGGGMILTPVFLYSVKLEEKKALATSVAVITPLCIISLFFYLKGFDIMTALPFLLGGLAGGLIGGRIFVKLNTSVLRRIFGAILLYGGIRAFI